MSFDRLMSFIRTNNESKQESSSIIDRTQSFISSSFRRSRIQTPSISEFEDYLASIPQIKKLGRKPKSSSANNSIKPELVKRCLQVVSKEFFNEHYQIDQTFFDRRIKVNSQKQQNIQQQLDQVEVCLFNQISSRFDEILSVLRTIQSLDLIVVQSQNKIRIIRQDNFKKVIQVTQKQNRMANLIRKKRNIEGILENITKLKSYQQFHQIQQKIEASQSTQAYYDAIPQLRKNIQFYKKLKSTRNVLLKIEETQQTLKRSFSDKINQKIFDYIKKDIPYQIEFWRRNVNNRDILEDKDADKDSTALLDESAIMGEQQSVAIIPKKQQNIENSIIEFIKNGLQDGQYNVNKFKNDIDSLLKSKHSAFMLDFRNFSDQICKKNQRQVENPSLTNLLRQISIVFCVKVYNYFFDIHKSMLMRFFSLNRKIFQLILSMSQKSLTITQKQKLGLLAEGFTNSGSFLVRIIVEKLIDIIDTKIVHEAIDISQFKQVIGVLENAEGFIEKQIMTKDRVGQVPSYLQQFFTDLQDRYPIKLIEQAKKRKLLDYLNKVHKNALTIELKQSLEEQIWQPTDIPTFYYDSLHYLITGQSLNLRRNRHNLKATQGSMMYETSVLMDGREQSFFQQPSRLMGNFRIIRNDIIINGITYKVTQTALLLLEIIQDYMTLAQNFPILKNEIGVKLNQIIRTYNMSTCQLIVHAGAVALQKIKTKNITSRHLSLSSVCLSFILYIMEGLQKRVEIFQYAKLKQSIEQHIDIIIKKLNQILIYKVTSVKGEINLKSTPSKGTESIVSNTKILLQILSDYYDKKELKRVFTKQVFNIYVDAISALQINSRVQAEALKDDVAFFFGQLKGLQELQNDYNERRIAAQDIVRRAFQQL